MNKQNEPEALIVMLMSLFKGNRTFRQFISDLVYREKKTFIIEAYIEDHEYNLQPKAKDQVKSLKQPTLRSLQKRYFFLETESKIKNRKIIKAVFENVIETYQLNVIAYRILTASSDIEYKGMASIKDVSLEPPKQTNDNDQKEKT